MDALAFEDVAQILGGDRLGEGAGQRGGVDELHPVADALLVEEPVGQHDELERRDRALDGVLHDVQDQPAAPPRAEMLGQGHGALDGVELEDRTAATPGPRGPGVSSGWIAVPVATTRTS